MEQPPSQAWPPTASPLPDDGPADYPGFGTAVDDEPGAAERSLVEDVRALVKDARLLAEAEIDFQKKRAGYGAQAAKSIVALFGAAGAAAFFAAMALVVGLVIALAPILTIWGSTALVTAALLVAAWLLASRGLAKLRTMKTMIAADADTTGRKA